MEKIISILFVHIENWNKAWFGLIFIGSIINAFLQLIPSLTDNLLIALIAYSLGLTIGLIANKRGKWL